MLLEGGLLIAGELIRLWEPWEEAVCLSTVFGKPRSLFELFFKERHTRHESQE